MRTPLRLLLIEDNEDDAELVCVELTRGGFDVDFRRIDTEPELRAALDEEWDLIISDFLMPELSGIRAFEIYKASGSLVPFLFISGTLGEERAVEAMRAGARDYFLKGKLARLNVAVERELERSRHLREQRRADVAVQTGQRRLSAAVEATGAGIFEYGSSSNATPFVSERCGAILGFATDEIPTGLDFVEWIWSRTHPDDLPFLQARYSDFVIGKADTCGAEVRLQHGGGDWVDVALFGKALARDESGALTHVVGVLLDMSERRHLETQFRQAQKMEAVGRLAGGVAHDFNNLLTVILSFGAFVLESLSPKGEAYEDMSEVLKAARSAESLTSQLLAFSRKRSIAPRTLQLNDAVREMKRMLGRILGGDVQLQTTLEPDLWNVYVDPSALEQVIINIAVNGRDAMPQGGKLTLETYNADLDESHALALGRDVSSGQYAVIAITDEGAGMDEELQRRIFDPFFTTKAPGSGTGLGLSTCYGIVKQAGGYIGVCSEPGSGTTFKIYLPRAKESVTSEVTPVRASSVSRGETILVVEDDEQVRRLVSRALSRLGYEVLEAGNGTEAITLCGDISRPMDLVLSDFIMPGMNGLELVERLSDVRRDLKVLFMSGYTTDALSHRGMERPAARLLRKPFTPDVLATAVREVLDG